jgi:hypothetical protein
MSCACALLSAPVRSSTCRSRLSFIRRSSSCACTSEVVIALNEPASRPISSVRRIWIWWPTSPRVTRSVAVAISPIGRITRALKKRPTATASTRTPAAEYPVVLRPRVATALSSSASDMATSTMPSTRLSEGWTWQGAAQQAGSL